MHNTGNVFVLEIGVYLQNSLQLHTGSQAVAKQKTLCMAYTGGVLAAADVFLSGGSRSVNTPKIQTPHEWRQRRNTLVADGN